MNLTITFTIPKRILAFVQKHAQFILAIVLSVISIGSFIYYYFNGLGLAYNDARAHLDIGRRIVENLKPGFAQLGSVWLPLPHLLMIATIWNDFMWHSGLSGAIQSMASYVITGLLIYSLLKNFGVSMLGRLIAVGIFALNTNIIYMQSTALTELLLLATMTAGVCEFILWHKEGNLNHLIKSGFWIMLATLIRYDGWFLLGVVSVLIVFHVVRFYGYKAAEGVLVLFFTLAGFGVFIWLFWNLMIFHNPIYFAVGPYSARAQQDLLEAAGQLQTKHNLLLSLQTYVAAVIFNTNFFTVVLSFLGMIVFWLDKKISEPVRIASIAFLSPLFFNVTALYLGHSALFVQGVSSDQWFNVRYGLMMIPTLAFFIGYLINKFKKMQFIFVCLLCLITVFSLLNNDAVTIDDARSGASGKNVSDISRWLSYNATDKNGYILISAASHDSIIFTSGLQMRKFIHEGTGLYWDRATVRPDLWVRWIVMKTNNGTDQTATLLKDNLIFKEKYVKARSFPFADVYQLKPEYVSKLQELPVLKENK